jgi:hypothetical protein
VLRSQVVNSARTISLKRLLLAIFVGVAVGFLGASFGGPRLISWWYEPPSRDAFSCAGSVRTALAQFVTFQLVCAGIGGAASSLVLLLTRRFLQRRASERLANAASQK